MSSGSANSLRRSNRLATNDDGQAESSSAAASTAAAAAAASMSSAFRKGPDPESNEYKIQMNMKLPGFYFGNTGYVFPATHKEIPVILGACFVVEEKGQRKYIPAQNQAKVVANLQLISNACEDEWLDDWQEKPLVANFWTEATHRLKAGVLKFKNITPAQVYAIITRYTSAWDANALDGFDDGGCANNNWGFLPRDLTWGNVEAEIDFAVLAKDCDYHNA